MTRAFIALALFFAGCEVPRSASENPGCHFVACGPGLMGTGSFLCGVRVDGRWVFLANSGQDALDFIRRNDLKTCETKP